MARHEQEKENHQEKRFRWQGGNENFEKENSRKENSRQKNGCEENGLKVNGSRKTTAKKGPIEIERAKTSPRNNSVDSILKRYQKERSTQESTLATLRKKIEDLEAKTEAYRIQILKLAEKEKTTETTIEQLDSRRDAEVSSLLSKLGVQFSGGGPSESTTTEPDDPVSDPENEPSDNGGDSSDEESGEASGEGTEEETAK